MKNIFTFKMIKVAGIVMSVVLGLGAMAPAMAVDLDSLAAAKANIVLNDSQTDTPFTNTSIRDDFAAADLAEKTRALAAELVITNNLTDEAATRLAKDLLATTDRGAIRTEFAAADTSIRADLGTFTSVAATAGTPAEAEILASITGTYTHPTTGAVSSFVITLAADGIWYEDGNPRTIATVEGLLDGSITYGGGITNVTGSLVYVAPVAAVAATEGSFAGDGLLGDVADAITAEQAARMMADASIRVEFASADTALIAAQALINTAIRGEFDSADVALIAAQDLVNIAIRSEFANADTALSGVLVAADTALVAAQALVNTAIRGEFDSADIALIAAQAIVNSAIRGEFAAADSAQSSALIAAQAIINTAIRSEFAVVDSDIRGEFAVVDSTIRGEFADADTAIRGEFADADTAIIGSVGTVDSVTDVRSGQSGYLGAVVTEADARISADSGLDSRLDDLEASSTGATNTGSITDLESNLGVASSDDGAGNVVVATGLNLDVEANTSDIADLEAIDNFTQAEFDTFDSANDTAIGNVQSDVDTNETDSDNADTAIIGSVGTVDSVTDVRSGQSGYLGAVVTEADARLLAEDLLSGRIVTLEGVDNFTQSEFGTFNTSNTAAIGTAKSAAISAAQTYANNNDTSVSSASVDAAGVVTFVMANGTNFTADLSVLLDNTDNQLTETQVDTFVSNNGFAQASDVTTNATAIALNTLKTGITGDQASAITANTAKISYTDASAVSANTAKISYTDASAVSANTAKISYTDASAVSANTAKISYTDASAVSANTLKVSVSSTDATDIEVTDAIKVETDARIADVNAVLGTITIATDGTISGTGDIQSLLEQLIAKVAQDASDAVAAQSTIDGTQNTAISLNTAKVGVSDSDATDAEVADAVSDLIGSAGSAYNTLGKITGFLTGNEAVSGSVKNLADARIANALSGNTQSATVDITGAVSDLSVSLPGLTGSDQDVAQIAVDNNARLNAIGTSDYRFKQVWNGAAWVNAEQFDTDGNLIDNASIGAYTDETAKIAGQVIWRFRSDIEGFTPNDTDAHVSFFAQQFEAINAAFVYGSDDHLKVDTLAVVSQNIQDIASEAVTRGLADLKIIRDQLIVDAVQNGRLDTIEGILVDHENRISRLESFHPQADGSFSKVIKDANGNFIAMHFAADGSMSGKPVMLTFLENPVVHGEFDILWNDAGEAVNARTGLRVDANTGLPMADKVIAEAKVVPAYVAAELASDVRFGTKDADVMVEAKVAAPVITQSETNAEIAKFQSMFHMKPVVESVAVEMPVVKAAVVEMVAEEVVVDEAKSYDLSDIFSGFFGGMFSSKTEVKAEVKAPVTTGNPFGK